ncbi:MAG TPA: hypothetical protein VHN20_04240 [Beijerinckiaceae bacterium]|nr:hypothetical protein [Beijerinckiaceae bacterium]
MTTRTAFALPFLLGLAATFHATAAQRNPPPDTVISVVSADWNEDGAFDRAILTEGEQGDADLYIYLSVPAQGDARRELALVKPNAAWAGQMAGTQPSLDVSARGALLLKSSNLAVGRGRWEQVVTIVYRNRQFIVAGFTRTESDTVAPNAGRRCDLNFLSGQGTRDGKRVTIGPQTIQLSAWNDEAGMEQCRLNN